MRDFLVSKTVRISRAVRLFTRNLATVETTKIDYDRHITAALWYAKQGWKIMPCNGIGEDGRCTCGQPHSDPKDTGKHPILPGYQNLATTDATTLEGWWRDDPRRNPAVMCSSSGFFVLDVDPRSGGFESLEKFEQLVEGNLPDTVTAITGTYNNRGKLQRGKHLYFRTDDNESLTSNLKAANLPGLDIKHKGYVLLPPSRHLSGVTYEWLEGREPWAFEMATAPEELLLPIRKRSAASSGSHISYSLGATDWGTLKGLQSPKLDINRMLEEGISEGSRAVDIYALACGLANKFGVDPLQRQMVETTMIRFNAEKVRPPLDLEGTGGLLAHVRRAIDFVATNPKHEGAWSGITEWEREQLEASVPKIGNRASNPMDVLLNTSDPDDFDEDALSTSDATGPFSNIFKGTNINVPKDVDALFAEDGGTAGQRSLTDTGNGRRLVDAFGNAIRYTPGLGWFVWNENYWRPDAEDLGTHEIAKRLSPIIASEVMHYEDSEKKKELLAWAKQAKSNARIGASIESATSDPRIGVPVDGWDGNPYLLGVANGVIDLKTGTLLRGRPDLHITRRAPVAYTEGLQNPRWAEFMSFATGGDVEYEQWLQKAVGYTLSGLSTYDLMFLVYGPAGSGKNTFVETIVKMMGTKEYAWPLDSSILAQGDGSQGGADLYHWAELRGRRMVWVDELPESERLKENSIKKLTGSSEISARSPGEKPFTFQSQAKLWITTNNRPVITDDAMWRRIRPIPWNHVPAVPNPGLKEYLSDPEGGLPGALAWAVEGAVKLFASKEVDALGWCDVVSDAAEVYRKNEDRMGLFLSENTNSAPGGSYPIRMLYSVYCMWSDTRRERPMTQIAFERKLNDRTSVTVTGVGASAELVDFVSKNTAPVEVSTSAGINFGNLWGDASHK